MKNKLIGYAAGFLSPVTILSACGSGGNGGDTSLPVVDTGGRAYLFRCSRVQTETYAGAMSLRLTNENEY